MQHTSVTSVRSAFALLLVLLCSPPAPPAAAQDTGPKDLAGLKYRSIGPAAGGRVSRAVGVPGDPRVYYAATASGGVWKSVNGGLSWAPVFDDQPISSIGSIAVSPTDPNIVYVGSGEANIRGNVAAGNGIYRSLDAGKTWTHVWKQEGQIGTIVIHPRNMPAVAVHDLVVKDHDLVAGTHGRSIWILDDLTPLRAFNDQVRAARAHLFTPPPAVAWQYRGGRRDRGTGANPQRGVTLTYLAMRGGARLYSRMSPLIGFVADGRGAPTQGMKEVAAEQRRELDSYEAELTKLMSEDVRTVNDAATRLGLAFVVTPSR